MPTKVVLPHLGESVADGTVERWLKQEGSRLEQSEPLLEVNTDKVSLEIPSPVAGTLLQICVAEGESVAVGTILAWIGAAGEPVPVAGALAAAEEVAAAGEATTVPAMDQVQQMTKSPTTSAPGRNVGFISPAVSRLSQEHHIDLSQVPGSGHNGRVTRKDIVAYLERQASSPPQEPSDRSRTPQKEKVAGGELAPHTSMRRAIASHMVRSKQIAPHVTSVMEADLSRVVEHRRAHKESFARQGVRLTYTPYVIAASAYALANHPFANASWQEDGILLHAQVNIGMATSLEDGLIVPVVKNAGDLSLLGLARTVNDLATRARSGRLAPAEVSGGTFTVTNYGVNGPLFGTPIINQPQCAILGVGLIQKRTVVVADSIAICPMVYLSLTFDHRILDGASADGFLSEVVHNLAYWS